MSSLRRTRAVVLTFLVVFVAACAAAPAASARVRLAGLEAEHAADPIGIDAPRPRLSWRLRSPRRGELQTAYQVQVASSARALRSGHADIWDSGRVPSAESAGIPYGGPSLESRTRYHWRVRVWDDAGRASAWSRPARWEMGLLDESDWSAHWIGGPGADDEAPSLDGASWIWFPEGDPTSALPPAVRYFRFDFDVPAGRSPTGGQLLMTADDSFVAYVNGERVGGTPAGGLWYDAQLIDVGAALRPGHNTVAIKATNALDTHGNPSPAGLLGRLTVDLDAGAPLVLDTGDTWRAATTEQNDWQQPGFDDSGWVSARELATYGGGPWGRGVQIPALERPAPLLRTGFDVDGRIKRARAYVAAGGYYTLRLNGRRVGDHVLDPAFTDFDHRVLYATYDVTRALRAGRNAIGATLGRGFYGLQTSTAWAWTQAPWHGEPRLIAQLEIEYADGRTERVVTDGRWRATDGPTRSDSVYGGETYDARRAQPGWARPGFDDGHWARAAEVDAPRGALRAQALEPIKVLGDVEPVAITQPEPGTYVFDMGRTLAGWARLHVTGPAGTRVSLEYGQQLKPDGTVNLDQGYVHGRFQRDEYVLRGGGPETWEPSFSYKDFRYVQVSGLPSPPDTGTVLGRIVHSAVRPAGSFSSSDALYDDIHAAMHRSIANHMYGLPAVDPMYEKDGWTADAQLNTPAFTDNYDVARLLAKWVGDMGDSQRSSGQIPLIVPSGGWGFSHAPEWTAAYPIIAWDLYERYGDRRVLETQYDGLARYVDWEISLLDDGLASTVLGDWLSPGYAQPPEDLRLTATAYVYKELRIMADVARVLGENADATRYASLAADTRDRFNVAFFDAGSGHYRTASDPGYRQTSNALPLAFGLVPAGAEDSVVDSLVADIHARGDHLNTGALGTAVLLRVLSRHGHADVAHAVANQRTYPSWGLWFEHGADTMWESWELSSDAQGRPPGRDHYLFGSIDQWFIEDLAGIQPAAPGYARIAIRPVVAGPLRRAAAHVDTVRGRVDSAWRKGRDGSLTLAVQVPPNARAEVHIPASRDDDVTEHGRPLTRARSVRLVSAGDRSRVVEVGSGRYRFRVRPATPSG